MRAFGTALLTCAMAHLSFAQTGVHAGHDTEETDIRDSHAEHDTTADEPAQASAAEVGEVTAQNPHAGHVMPAEPPDSDPHAGHVMPAEQNPAVVDHSMHDAPDSDAPALRDMPAPPEAFSGPAHAADTVFDADIMARSRELLRDENGDFITYWIMADGLERIRDDDQDLYTWDVQGWYGGDTNKLWIKTEGEGNVEDKLESAELQALWSRAIRPFFDIQAGIRHDLEPGPSLSHAVIGVQGLVPYEFELDAAAFLSERGDLTARLEFEYDLRITQRLVLQPRMEMDLAAQDILELGVGSGLGTGEFGLRLRYEFAREFAPYIGVKYERLFGATADYARNAGEGTRGWNFIFGLRTWF